MTTQPQLNQLNADLLAQIADLSWEDATKLGQTKDNLANTTAYRNALLKSLEGRVVTVKGYLVNKTNPVNYTVGNACIYVDGHKVDTVQHISVYADLLSASDMNIGGVVHKCNGNYSLKELTETFYANKDSNVPYLECQPVEFTGISYSYSKRGCINYSIGTERQVAYAAN